MSVRSHSRGSPAASSIRLALRTSSIVATRSASFVRWVFRWFGSRRLSSVLRLSAISVMPFMMRFQGPPRAEALNHTPIHQVNNLLAELIDGKKQNLIHIIGMQAKRRYELSDAQWARLEPLLPPAKPWTGRPNDDHRRILNGILGIRNSGARGRALPRHYGRVGTVSSRFYRWRRSGVWQRVLEALQARAGAGGGGGWGTALPGNTGGGAPP